MKGLFIPEITSEMFRNGCLESIEQLMAEGEIYDIDYPLEQEPVLDKIRAEIEQKARPNEIGGRENGKSIRYGLYMALEIIDKYSEDWVCKGCWCDDGEVHIDCVFCDKIGGEE